MSILAEYRWYFLIGAEIVFWLAAIGFFLLRYGFRFMPINLRIFTTPK
ncbi:hypothetical protein [Bacillus paranthracis]